MPWEDSRGKRCCQKDICDDWQNTPDQIQTRCTKTRIFQRINLVHQCLFCVSQKQREAGVKKAQCKVRLSTFCNNWPFWFWKIYDISADYAFLWSWPGNSIPWWNRSEIVWPWLAKKQDWLCESGTYSFCHFNQGESADGKSGSLVGGDWDGLEKSWSIQLCEWDEGWIVDVCGKWRQSAIRRAEAKNSDCSCFDKGSQDFVDGWGHFGTWQTKLKWNFENTKFNKGWVYFH